MNSVTDAGLPAASSRRSHLLSSPTAITMTLDATGSLENSFDPVTLRVSLPAAINAARLCLCANGISRAGKRHEIPRKNVTNFVHTSLLE